MPLGPLELLLIIVVIALVFGARKLPELGKGLGQGIREFKKETRTQDSQTPVTDVPSRPLDSVTTVRPVETPAERDHRA